MLRRKKGYGLLAFCLTVLALFCTAPALTYAAAVDPATPGDASVQVGDFTVTGGRNGSDYRYEDHVLYILTDAPVTISGKTTLDRIRVESGVNANITLAGVDIRIPDAGQVPAFEIAEGSGGNVTVTLADGSANVLKSGMWCAGLQKDGAGSVGTLTIRCQGAGRSGHICTAACGSLSAAGYWGAGIGSGASQNSKAHAVKNITISGGNIHASSATHGAGIGAGSMGSAENIAIRGGIVEAEGGAMGVGIGDSAFSHAVTISGGKVTASGGSTTSSGSGGSTVFGIGGRLVTKDAAGRPGNACIVLNSLADQTGQESWSGVILIGREGRVWGSSVRLSYSAVIPAGTVLTVPEGAALTMAAGARLTVNGKLRADGTINGAEQISGTDVRYRLTVKNGKASGPIDGGYVREGEQITLVPAEPGSAELLFAGWDCTPADLKITENRFRMPASPVSAEARYEKTRYTVSFDLNGGSADQAVAEQTILPGGRAAAPEAVMTPPAGKCRLDGWYTADGKKWDFASEVRSSMKLSARWADHDAGTKWEKTADGHEELYACCGAVKTEKTAHTWNADGTCGVCGYACAHADTERKNRRPADCTSDGYTGDVVCTVCGKVVKAGSRVSRTGHSYGGWDYDRSCHWRVCDDCGGRGGYGSHVLTSWTASNGWKYEKCEKCGYQVMFAASGSGVPGSAVPSAPGAGPGSGLFPQGSSAARPGSGTGTVSPGAGTVPPAPPAANPGTVQGAPSAADPGTTQGAPSAANPGTVQGASSAANPGAAQGGASSAANPGAAQGGASSAAQPGTAQETQPAIQSGSGAGTGNTDTVTTPSGEDAGTDPGVSEGVTVTLIPEKESGSAGSGKPSDETMNGSGDPDRRPVLGAVGELIFDKTPWWFWLFVLAAAAVLIIAFAVIADTSGNGDISEDEDPDMNNQYGIKEYYNSGL